MSVSLDPESRFELQWRELAGLVRRARGRGARRLTEEELIRLDRLYRLAAIHLAQAQSRTRDRKLIDDLNRLVTSAHTVIYAPTTHGAARGVLQFFTSGFSRAVARGLRFHALASFLMVLGIAGGWYIATTEPDGAYLLMPPGDIRLPGASIEQLEAVLRSGREMGVESKSGFAAMLFAHNTKVGIGALATGVLGGIPTVYMMLFNGALLGAFSHVHTVKGISVEMWSWLLPHGVTELGAIALCGGAGLRLGAAVVAPGTRSRQVALAEAGREAVYVIMGVAVMLFFAGMVESFVRQSTWSIPARFAFAGATAVFWAVYFLRGVVLERGAAGAESREGL